MRQQENSLLGVEVFRRRRVNGDNNLKPAECGLACAVEDGPLSGGSSGDDGRYCLSLSIFSRSVRSNLSANCPEEDHLLGLWCNRENIRNPARSAAWNQPTS
jgi:hypothetical protein